MSVASMLVFVECFDFDGTTFFSQQKSFPLNFVQTECIRGWMVAAGREAEGSPAQPSLGEGSALRGRHPCIAPVQQEMSQEGKFLL